MWSGVSSFVKASFKGQKAWRFVAALCGVFLILGLLVRYSFLNDFDLRFTKEIQETSNPFISSLMLAATFLGNGLTLCVGGAIVAAILAATHRPRAAGFALASLIGLPVDMLLKEIWDRARPDATIVHVAVRTSGTSFPSGHALGSTMFYGALAALTYIHLPKGTPRTVAVVALALVPFFVATSRVYLGAHWLSDVVGGTAIGLALLIPLIKWYAEHVRKDKPVSQNGSVDAAHAK
jgi:undecaprenyl-diphosphatase